MATIANLSIKMTLDDRQLQMGVQRVNNQLKNFRAGDISKQFTGVTRSMSSFASAASAMAGPAAVAVAAITAVGMAVVRTLGPAFERLGNQSDLGVTLGISHQQIQRLSLAAKLSGTNVETLGNAMIHMGKTIGSGGMPLDKRMLQQAEAIARIKDPAERAAKAMKIFGRENGKAMLPFIREAEDIKAATRSIDRFGLAISDVDAAKVEKAGDALVELKFVTDGFIDKTAVLAAPFVELGSSRTLDGIEKLGRAMERLGVTMEKVDGIAQAMLVGLNSGLSTAAGAADAVIGSKGIGSAGSFASGAAGRAGRLAGGAPGSGGSWRYGAALERGSMGAASAVLAGGGNPLGSLLEQNKAMAAHLRNIEGHLDPGRNGAVVRKAKV